MGFNDIQEPESYMKPILYQCFFSERKCENVEDGCLGLWPGMYTTKRILFALMCNNFCYNLALLKPTLLCVIRYLAEWNYFTVFVVSLADLENCHNNRNVSIQMCIIPSLAMHVCYKSLCTTMVYNLA